MVATAPTVYGIETSGTRAKIFVIIALQQHLPFTVLKRLTSVGQVLQLMLPCCNSTYRLRY